MSLSKYMLLLKAPLPKPFREAAGRAFLEEEGCSGIYPRLDAVVFKKVKVSDKSLGGVFFVFQYQSGCISF